MLRLAAHPSRVVSLDHLCRPHERIRLNRRAGLLRGLITKQFARDIGESGHPESGSQGGARPLGKPTFGRKDLYAKAATGSDAERLLHRAATDQCRAARVGAGRNVPEAQVEAACPKHV